MPRRRNDPDEPLQEPTEEEFEELVAATLKVDPTGLSGKHRKGDGPATNYLLMRA